MSRRGGVADPMVSAAVRARIASAATAATAQALTPSPRMPLTCAVSCSARIPMVTLASGMTAVMTGRVINGRSAW